MVTAMEPLTDIELTQVVSKLPQKPLLSGTGPDGVLLRVGEPIETKYGTFHVTVQGDPKKPAIITYHDIGMNHATCFNGFFSYCDMRILCENFCIYHIDAPGHEDHAHTLPQSYTYPRIDELTEMVGWVYRRYGFSASIGLGSGAGANILARFALKYPEKVRGLCLINPIPEAAGWVEWLYQKRNIRNLSAGQVSRFSQDYFLWHFFGYDTLDRNNDLSHLYKRHLLREVNPCNVARFVDAYIGRSDLDLLDDNGHSRLKCNTLIVTGDASPHCDDSMTMAKLIEGEDTSFVRFADCGGMPLEEQPGKLFDAFKYQLQGIGYLIHFNKTFNEKVSNKEKELEEAQRRLEPVEGADSAGSPVPC